MDEVVKKYHDFLVADKLCEAMNVLLAITPEHCEEIDHPFARHVLVQCPACGPMYNDEFLVDAILEHINTIDKSILCLLDVGHVVGQSSFKYGLHQFILRSASMDIVQAWVRACEECEDVGFDNYDDSLSLMCNLCCVFAEPHHADCERALPFMIDANHKILALRSSPTLPFAAATFDLSRRWAVAGCWATLHAFRYLRRTNPQLRSVDQMIAWCVWGLRADYLELRGAAAGAGAAKKGKF